MKKIILLLILLVAGAAVYPQLNAEQTAIRNTFFDFLKFYQDNEKQFYSFKLYKGTGEENGPPYHIDWKEADRYCNWLRASVPYVGEAYISNERNDFKFYDSCYKADKEEEIPIGFDYDRWSNSQESIEYMAGWYTSPKNKYIVTIAGNKAELKIGAELQEGEEEKDRFWYIVPFVKEKGKWKMAANISPLDQEDEPAN